MARPKSDDKRNSILAVATEEFAQTGLSASLAKISKAAGVAEGTLFIYFKGKEELINAVYISLKLDLADAIMNGYPRKGSIRSRTQHVWNKYVDWGARNPDQVAVLHKIAVWEGLTAVVREAASAPFAEIRALNESAKEQHIFQDIPQEYITAIMTAQAETTMHFMRQDHRKSYYYKEKGFEIFWNGICRKR